MPDPQPPPRREPRSVTLFALFLAVGLVAFGYVWVALHRRAAEQLSTSVGPRVTHAVIQNWIRHGYLASGGALMASLEEKVVYRWSSGVYLASALVLEKIWIATTGRYSWRLIALHNTVIALLTATSLAMLAYRIARRTGIDPLHAFVLGVAAQMVHFTFPGNLALYWELTSQALGLLAVLVFLLLEERAADERRRIHTILQGVAIFALAEIDWLYAAMFIAAYVATALALRDERPPLRRLVLMLLVPWLVAFALYRVQMTVADRYAARIGAKVVGSSFPYRSGLDGDAMFYRNHLDIAYGRDVVRAGRPGKPQYLFRWPSLFFGGVVALLAVLAAYVRGRTPRIAVIVLATLAGVYLLFAATLSQWVVLHPYLFDILLVTPLILALFAIAPALVEAHTNRTGLVVLVTFFGAVWLSMFHLRLYALAYPSRFIGGS